MGPAGRLPAQALSAMHFALLEQAQGGAETGETVEARKMKLIDLFVIGLVLLVVIALELHGLSKSVQQIADRLEYEDKDGVDESEFVKDD